MHTRKEIHLPLSSQQLLERVRNARGRVDFVFADDRPFAQCHASTLAPTRDGGLLCAWFAGTREAAPDVGVWLSRFHQGAWSTPERVAKIADLAHWNPVLFSAPDGEILLFFKVGATIPRWRTFVMRSSDGGAVWSEARELVPGDTGGRGPVRSKPLVLSDGSWLAPASTEQVENHPGSWCAFVDRSRDRGHTWERSPDFSVDPTRISGPGVIQPALWESAPGRVHALLRTGGGVIARTDSNDDGRTWSPVRPTALPNNNSGIDVLRLDDGRVLLAYNPVAENWGPRTPLTLAVSTDNGETWRDMGHVEDDDALQTQNGSPEYSYPTLVRTPSGVALSYTWRRERVRCWQIPLAALTVDR